MVTPDRLQRYQHPAALERLLLLIAVLLQNPGIGCKPPGSPDQRHDALKAVQQQWQAIAREAGLDVKPSYPALATLRKDLETLRQYQILEKRMYRWGYYLGTGVFQPDELQIVFNALASQALNQGDQRTRQVYEKLRQRLRGLALPDRPDCFYPVRQYLNRVINYTNPLEMMEKGEYRHTLYHQIDTLEQAILQGQAIEISRVLDPYQEAGLGMMRIYPLQLAYYDIAWYLLTEEVETGNLGFSRMNRLSDYCRVLPLPPRGLAPQQASLSRAYRLLENGWGLKLGNVMEQSQELAGELAFISVKVRFFPPISQFIEEGERRHPRQKLILGDRHPATGKPCYVDYCLNLPPRSLPEFSIWVQRYADKAQVLAPPALVDHHRQTAIALASLYGLLPQPSQAPE